MQETLAPVSSCALMVSELWRSSVVEAVVLSEGFELMRLVLKPPTSGLFLSKEGYGFLVTKDSNGLNGSKESNELSLVEVYMSIGTEVEIPAVIILIALIEISIDSECDSEW